MLNISMGDYTFFMRGFEYMLWEPSVQACLLMFRGEPDPETDFWLLGDPFLRAYLQVYDMENNRLGLVGVSEDFDSAVSTFF